MNLDEIQQIFFQECEEGLGALETAFADLKRGRHDDETINTVFRSVHSIKGGAGAFGHDRLQHFSHHYETVLDLIRNGTLPLSEPLIDLIVAAFDTLTDHVAAARGEGGMPADQAMLDRLAAAAEGRITRDAGVQHGHRGPRPEVAPLPGARGVDLRHVPLAGQEDGPQKIGRAHV